MDEDGLPYGKKADVINHQMRRLPSSLMNSLQSKEDIELFHMHNMEEIDVQHDLTYDHINVKEMCLNDIYQVPFLKFMDNITFFCFYIGLKVLRRLFVIR